MLRRCPPLFALLLIAAVVLPAHSGEAAAIDTGTTRSFGPPVGNCYTTPDIKGLAPNQVADAYGLTPLWNAGYQGQGIRMALLDPNELPEMVDVDHFKGCQGISAPVSVHLIGTGADPLTQGEATLDVEVALTAAPKLDGLYLFSNRGDLQGQIPLVDLLEAAMDPNNTGGQRVDAISVSFGKCEQEASQEAGYLEAMNTELQKAANQGITVFFAGGDSDSSACAAHPVAENAPHWNEAAIGFPGSSPWVVTVGGTMMDVTRQADGAGVIEVERVWNEEYTGKVKDGGGGGTSEFFFMPSWQTSYGLPGANRKTPDVAAMAGSPAYSPGSDDATWFGTSAASPFTAGGWAVVLSALQAKGVAKPGFLAPILYQLAKSNYSTVFRDITVGSNDLWGQVHCCDAGPGWDNASGLGSLRFDGLLAALAPTTPSSSTTTTTGAPVSTTVTPVVATPRFTG